jgi:uncharacterized membrane protein
MLFYLIRIIDSTWVLAIGAPLVVYAQSFSHNGPWRHRLMSGAILLGLLDGFVYAYLRRNTGIVIRELYDLGVLWPYLLAAVVWTVAAYLSLSPKGQPGWTLLVSGPLLIFLLLARILPDALIYPLDFGLGLDSYFNFDYLMKWTGYLTGLLLMLLLAMAIAWICRRAPKSVSRYFLLASFLFLSLDLLMETAQIMYVRRMLPNFSLGSLTPGSLVLFFLNHKMYFVFAQIIIWGALSLGLMVRAKTASPTGANPALVRKSRYGLILSFRAGLMLLICLGLTLFAVTSLRAIEERGPYIAEPEEVLAQGGELRLDLEVAGDGDLHRHMYKTASGTAVRFIVIKKTANSFGVGLDACDICGQSGYYQRGDQVICKLCDVVMNKTTIGFPGGCNPVPLNFRIASGNLVIDTASLEEEEHRFQ